jgi:hypothetical protein
VRHEAPRWLRGSRARVLASVLAAAALVGATGLVADASSASAPQPVRVHLGYDCRFPSGSHQVTVTVAGTFPATAVVGQPTKISGQRTTVALPRPEVASLRKLGATAVTGASVLATTVANNTKVLNALWPGRVRKPAAIAGTGSVHLTFAGAVPPVTASAPGTVTFTAAGLTLALAFLRTADTSQLNQPIVRVACTLSPGQEPKLAAIAVATPSPSAPATPSSTSTGKHSVIHSKSGGIPPGCGKRIVHGGISSPLLGCAYLVGYADVAKFHEAALIGPAANGSAPGALLDVDTYGTNLSEVHGTLQLFNCTAAQLNYHNQFIFPPAKTTFLTFGFVPVTAVLQLSEATWPSPPKENPRCYKGNLGTTKPVHLTSPLISVFTDTNTNVALGEPVLNTGTTYLSIHVSQVAVNGVPLNVGSLCGVPGPVKAVLVGHGKDVPEPEGYTVAGGGPLTGSVTIPNFTHCGVGENLDSLLTSGISGPANFQLMTQGVLCVPVPGRQGCPPAVPKPLRHV